MDRSPAPESGQDLFDEKLLFEKVEQSLDHRNQIFVKVFNRMPFDAEKVTVSLEFTEPLRGYVAETRGCSTRHSMRASWYCSRDPRNAPRCRPRHLSVRHVIESDSGWSVRRFRD